ncbi:MATE family efflux transporter [Marinisporobacter balticus]|uniref:Multidrug export protein MepA n=1 Tax=Marinisporobacter balticus TaxID=2018667 RepID=A0A4R2K611_9FIRM|nr:MATE family efflux transporter [Marinisporobacter balticus]TCO68691.1 putative MATE family efflux protein [Marinisporobacter balticus]
MNENNKKLYLLKDEQISTALLKLGIPTMVGMLISALYNVVDAYCVGELGTAQMGAVSVVFPLGLIMTGIALLFGSGASSYLARLLGNKQYKEANRCASTALFTSIAVGVIIIVIMLVFVNPILRCLGATDTIFPFAREYAVIFISGLVFNVFNVTVNNMIIAEGAAKFSMIAMLIGGMTNMLLDIVSIYVLKMGINGVAIATLISRIISTILYLTYILSGKSVFKISIRNIKPSKDLYIEIFKIGLPVMIFQILSSIALGSTNTIASAYGDSAVAAIGIASRIMSLGTMAIFGFLKGFQAFVGYNYGSGRMDRVEKSKNIALLWTTCFCAIVTVCILLFSKDIIYAFNKNDPAVMSIGRKVLILNGIIFLGLGFQLVYGTFFLALGKSKEGGAISVCRQGAFFIPLVLIMPIFFNLNGLIIAQPLADMASIILVFILKSKQNLKPNLKQCMEEV